MLVYISLLICFIILNIISLCIDVITTSNIDIYLDVYTFMNPEDTENGGGPDNNMNLQGNNPNPQDNNPNPQPNNPNPQGNNPNPQGNNLIHHPDNNNPGLVRGDGHLTNQGLENVFNKLEKGSKVAPWKASGVTREEGTALRETLLWEDRYPSTGNTLQYYTPRTAWNISNSRGVQASIIRVMQSRGIWQYGSPTV